MKKLITIAAALAVLAVGAGAAHAGVSWKLMKSASDSGDYASAYASGFVNRPVSFKATASARYGADITQSVDCEKGSRSVERERDLYVRGTRTWTFKPTIARPDQCYVSVSVSGDWDAGPQTVKVRLYQRGGSTW